jgi:transcriptional regulator with XRE-family HTH domain
MHPDVLNGPSARLRGARLAAGKSLSEAAGIVGTSRQAVHKWEQNPAEVKAGKLAALCQFYGVTMESVLAETSPPRLSVRAQKLAEEFDGLPRDQQRQWMLLWEMLGRCGVPDPVGPAAAA